MSNLPSLHDLLERREHAAKMLFCADYIDNTERRNSEKDRWQREVNNVDTLIELCPDADGAFFRAQCEAAGVPADAEVRHV